MSREDMIKRREYNDIYYNSPDGQKKLEKIQKEIDEKRSWTLDQYWGYLYKKFAYDDDAIKDLDFEYQEKDRKTFNDLLSMEASLMFIYK